MSQKTAWDNVSVSTLDEKVVFSDRQEIVSDKFKRINYAPSNFYIGWDWLKYPRYLYAVGSAIVLTLIIIIALISADNHGLKIRASKEFRGHILLTVDNTKIMKFNFTTQNVELILKTPIGSVISSFDGSEDDCIHWVEAKASRLNYRCNSQPRTLLEDERFKPEGLALDRVTGNTYVVDQTAGTLIVISRNNGRYAILLTDLINARELALDSEEGYVFILQHSHSILRSYMDGSDPQNIITNTGVVSLTVDTIGKRLYWINDYVNIESSNYDGQERHSIFTEVTRIAMIAAVDDHLFWVWPNNQRSQSLILSCQINDDGTCKNHTTHKINADGNIQTIRGFSQSPAQMPNPCKANNGGCEQLCLISGREKITCACRMGWQLNPDRRSCQAVHDFVLYVYDNFVRTCSLDGKQEIFWPTPFTVNKLVVKTEIDFDYDFKNDYFYFTDDHHIYRMKLKSYTDQEIILSVRSADMIVDDLAYDWITGNIYYGERHAGATYKHSLVIFNTHLGESYRKSIPIFGDKQIEARSYAMVLHPSKGYLFVAATHAHERDTEIYRAKLDGAEFNSTYHFFANGVHDHRFFTLDFTTDRLYVIQEKAAVTWIGYKSVTQSSDNMHFINSSDITDARTIAVHQQWLYLSNFSRILRFDKDTLGDGLVIAPRIENSAKKIIGVRTISEETQNIGLDNPCARNNGGCQQFCFSDSIKPKCECKDGQRVNNYGRCN